MSQADAKLPLEFDDFPEKRCQNYRVFIVVRKLPIRVVRNEGKLLFLDDDVAEPVTCAATKLQDEGIYTFTWIGGLSAPNDLKKEEWDLVHKRLAEKSYIPVFVTKPLWVTFCKCCLWPIMNSQLTARKFSLDEWHAYKDANRTFAETVNNALIAHAKTSEVPYMLWIHNYHLMLLPAMLRKLNIICRIGYFFHTPFPSSELIRVLPTREKLLKGVLAANFLGFQTYHCNRHFLSSCTRVLSLDVTPREVRYKNRSTQVGVYPVGTDPDHILDNYAKIREKAQTIRDMFPDTKLIVGRDRLDNLMGILEKLKAFEALLQKYPEWQNKVKLFQICLPPADFLGDKNKYKKDMRRTHSNNNDTIDDEDLSGVQELRSQINIMVGRINGQYSSADFTPIHYYNRDLDSFEEVAALYAASDAALITPLREGMNLTSHEFVVCQKERKSPLVLSEFTGSAQCLVGSILVNPHDISGVAAAINQALTMSDSEKALKHDYNLGFILQNTAQNWGRVFLHDLAEIELCDNVPRLHIDETMSSYKRTRNRLFIFEYDGILEGEYTEMGDLMRARLLAGLQILCSKPENKVYIVSHRDRAYIEQHIGHIPAGLACEDGKWFREYGYGSKWENLSIHFDTHWQESVISVLDVWASVTPGSAIEAKDLSIIWNYKNVQDKEHLQFSISELLPQLQALASKLPIDIITGDKSIEVRPQNMNKGAVVRSIFAANPDADFVLCIGDSNGNDDVFNNVAVLCKKECNMNNKSGSSLNNGKKVSWFTCGIGGRETSARYYLPNKSQVASLVKMFATVAEKKVYQASRLRAIGRYTSAPTVSNPVTALLYQS